MKKHFFLLVLMFTAVSYSQQTIPANSRLRITKNVEDTSANKIVVKSDNDELNWIHKDSLKPMIGLENVDNTSDVNKPVSIAVQASLDTKIDSSLINANNGVAPLDAGGKVPFSNLPAALMIYKGMWTPDTNSPTLADGTGVAGWVYKVTANGSANLGSGSISFLTGDFVIHNGTNWERSVGTDNVVSVNGQQGVVSLTTANISDSSNKRYQTDAQQSYNDATSSIQTQLNNKEFSFAKNTAFNKNFGTTSGTVAQGDDSRILNGQTAFSWGNHSGLYQPLENQRVGTGYSPSFLGLTLSPTDVFNGTYSTLTSGYGNYTIGSDGAGAYAGLTIKAGSNDNVKFQTNGSTLFGELNDNGSGALVQVNGSITATGGSSTNWNTAYGWGSHTGLYPARNGTGAVGDWYINIHGNATSATNWGGRIAELTNPSSSLSYMVGIDPVGTTKSYVATTVQSWLGLNNVFKHEDGTRTGFDFNSKLSSGIYNQENLGTNYPGSMTYGNLIVAKGIDTGLQIYGGFNNDQLWFRGWENSGATFSPWRNILHGGNYNSYAPSLTGTGASGTWGINIAGNSNSTTNWGGRTANFDSFVDGVNYLSAKGADEVWRVASAAQIQSFLGLGSNAYTSTAYAPLDSASFTGTPTAPDPTAPTGIANKSYVDNAIANNTSVNGTFTPSASGNITFLKSYYTRVGNILTIQLNMQVNITASSTGGTAAMTMPNSYTTANISAGRVVGSNVLTYGSNTATGGLLVKEATNTSQLDIVYGGTGLVVTNHYCSATIQVEVN